MLRPSALLIALALGAAPAAADPGYYVVTPYTSEGVLFADFRYWTVAPEGRTEANWPELGLGYGVNSRWTTELFMSWIGGHGTSTLPSSLNWQNNVLLTQGEWPLDVALHLQWVSDRFDTHHQTLEFGPLLQTDIGRTQFNANLIFERDRGLDVPRPTQLKYQWQWRWRWMPPLHIGMQGFGELGPWNDWTPSAQQSHRAGPAAFGTWRLDEQRALKLQAAWLVGKTYGRQGHMFTLRATAEF